MIRGFVRTSTFIKGAGLAVAVFALLPAIGQGFNIDLDIGGGDPGIGAGAPSDAFGAAANQSGWWNRVDTSDRDIQLVDSLGSLSTVQMSVNHFGGPAFGVGFAFNGNTGDFALLLNDAAVVGTTGQGGQISYGFSGFAAGSYAVYTYAANTSGFIVPVPVIVPEANNSQTQIVTGPMPGNGFGYLITHSIHIVDLAQGGTFHVNITQPPALPAGHGYCVNGFQIAPIAEPSTLVAMALFLGCLTAAFKRRA